MKTAVFIDWENLNVKSANIGKELPALFKQVENSGIAGEIALVRVYISKSHSACKGVRAELEKLNIELVEVEPFLSSNKKGNMVDFKMSVDIVATIAAKRSISTVVLGSGDSDFGFLCQQIKLMNRRLIIVSNHMTTGDSIYRMCDYWLDASGMAVTPKFICRIINLRHTIDYGNTDFLTAIADFLSEIEKDIFARQYMINYGLPAEHFAGLLSQRKIAFAKYKESGFSSMTDFVGALLCDSNFEYKYGTIKYTYDKEPISQINLVRSYMSIPDGYSREKLMSYYDVLENVDDLDEFSVYFNFMRRNGMINDNILCNRRTFRSAIRKNITTVMRKFGIFLSDDTISKVDGLL